MDGIWIRTQDKHQLVKAEAFTTFQGAETIRLQLGRIVSGDKSGVTAIGMYTSNGYVYFAGAYPTEERALKVLDDIHGFIDCDGELNRKVRVFEMPAE